MATLSPKYRFIAQKNLVDQHASTIRSESFLVAADAAMLELILSAPKSDTEYAAAANYNQIIGAREFLKKLNTIGEKPEPTTPPTPHHLNHNR